MPAAGAAAIERAFREGSGRAVAVLARLFEDIDLAEEAAQEAFAVAVLRWHLPSPSCAGRPMACRPVRAAGS